MGVFKETKIASLGELLDRLTPSEPEPVSGRRRLTSIYRGVADTDWSLLTSLDRLGGHDKPHSKRHLEEHIFRNFIRYARPFLRSQTTSDWELLITAQHHGMPTRLLDWTFSPLIAVHFATLLGDRTCDRVVWRLDWRPVHDYFGLKPLAFLVSDLDEVLKQKGYDSVWKLFESSGEEELFVCMLEPPAIDARLLAQNAAFTLSSSKTRSLDQILRQCDLTHCLERFVIPASKVEFIRDQLDMCNVDERRLFPDLDGVAAELRRYYSASAEDSGGRSMR